MRFGGQPGRAQQEAVLVPKPYPGAHTNAHAVPVWWSKESMAVEGREEQSQGFPLNLGKGNSGSNLSSCLLDPALASWGKQPHLPGVTQGDNWNQRGRL